MIKHIIGFLLYYANRDIDFFLKRDFYPIKNKIIKKYGAKDGFDIQHIKKKCWNCHGSGVFKCSWKKDEQCFSCSGTGIYVEKLISLDRYKIGRFVFHSPSKSDLWRYRGEYRGAKNIIHGYIKHTPPKKNLGKEAMFILFFIYNRLIFKRVIGICKFNKPRTPLVFINNLVLWTRERQRKQEINNDDLPF